MNNYIYLKAKKFRELTELIIGISYKCNSKCRFCQWNITNSHETHLDLPLNQLLLSRENIISFNISRIVLSGGEPTLANDILKIISYYEQFSLPIRVPKFAIEKILPEISIRASEILSDLTDSKFNQIIFIPLGGNRVGFEIYVFDGERNREASISQEGKKHNWFYIFDQ